MPLLLAILLWLLPSASARGAEDIAALIEQLQAPDSAKWSRAYTELMRRRDPRIIPLLLKAAPTLAITPQSYAVYLINALPDSKDTRAALRKLTRMKPPYLRARAAKALYDKGEKDIEQVAIEVAREARDDASIASLVISALSYFRSAKLQAELRSWLASGPSEAVFARLVSYFHLIPDRKQVLPILAERLKAESATIRGLAAAYLYTYGPAGAAAARGKLLAEALQTGEIEYAEFITIDAMLTKRTSVAPEILDAVAERLPDESGYYAARMLQFLARGKYAGVAALARKRLDDPDAQVSKAAFDVLAGVSGGFSKEALAGLLGSADETRRLRAAESLRRADDRSGLSAVIEVLAGGKVTTARREAARMLGEFRQARSVEPLLDALGDADSLVRSYAGSSLARVWATLFPYRRIDVGSTGWSYTAPEATRRAAIEQLRAWWTAHKGANW